VEKVEKPIVLTARWIDVEVLRAGQRNEMSELNTEGAVHVVQEGETAKDKGVDIYGETLKLTRNRTGNLLVVTDEQNLAQLQMEKMKIVGPTVYIDQAADKAWVRGAGFMEMDSNVDFQGGKLKKSTPMSVTWKKSMFFDGQNAEFYGGVQAEQDTSFLLCEEMQVFLDQKVSFKPSPKAEKTQPTETAKVRKLSCDKSVTIEDKTFENGKLVKYQRISCPEAMVDNELGEMTGTGPGVVRILQAGNVQVEAGKTAAPQRQPITQTSFQRGPIESKDKKPVNKDDQLKLTKINYAGRMYANNKNHTAVFTDGVEVVNVPSDDPNIDPNVDKLPEGGFYLHSDKLKVYSGEADGKKSNELLAEGRIQFRVQDYYGLAHTLSFHEGKDQVILEGAPAKLFKLRAQGGLTDEIRAKKIIYIRKTGEFQIINGESFTGQDGR
jgi:lipopolysaccharide export system protein LptA